MLVIVSDLHLSDGSLGATVPATAMEFFAGKLNELALAAGFRDDGHYRPIERIDLVLLGDVLDLIRSAEWLSTNARPWHDSHSAGVFDAVSRVTAGVLDQNAAALEILRQLARGDIAGVPVRIHYMVGDHDWPLHLPGEQYGRLRAQVVERMGLANHADLPFPHDPAESQELLDALRRHRVLARHGDIYDPIHFETDRNSSSLGDILSIELFGRFQLEMRRSVGELSDQALAGLAELHDVRPMLLAPAWIDDVLEHDCDSAAKCSDVRSIWDRLVEQLLESPAIRSREVWRPVDLVDELAESLLFRGARFNRRHSSRTGLADCFNGDGAPSEIFPRHAAAEDDFRNGNAKYVVYGHTHQTEFAPLASHSAADGSPGPVYFNAGAWRPVISPAHRSPPDSLTYLAFFEQDEHGGQPYEAWTGSWTRPSAGNLIQRFDSSRAA